MDEPLRIADDIVVPAGEIDLRALRARGAGGQNVNKVATAIQLRFDFEHSDALPARLKKRLRELGDARVTSSGIVIKADEFRSQARNRAAAVDRLRELLETALEEPKPRIATRPGRAAKKKRVEQKRRRGEKKRLRGRPDEDRG